MRVRMKGILAELREDRIILESADAAHELLIPAFAVVELGNRRGELVELFTLEFLEAGGSSSVWVPRILGFPREIDRAFFQKLTSVKGVGPRTGLKAMSTSPGRIAQWIEEGNTAALSKLKGIGPKGARMLVAELKGKLEAFLGEVAFSTQESGGAERVLQEAAHDALSILVGWGDSHGDALRWLEEAGRRYEGLSTCEEWVRAAYRIKTGS